MGEPAWSIASCRVGSGIFVVSFVSFDRQNVCPTESNSMTNARRKCKVHVGACLEDDGPVVLQQHAVLDVPFDGAG